MVLIIALIVLVIIFKCASKKPIKNEEKAPLIKSEIICEIKEPQKQLTAEERKQEEQEFIDYMAKNPDTDPLYLEILNNYPRPKILNFLSEDDYKHVIRIYVLSKHIREYRISKEYFEREYCYPKYEWRVCYEALRTYMVFNKYTLPNIQQMKEAGIEKVKLLCCNDEICNHCKKNLNRPININNIKELPMPECQLDIRLCVGATYTAYLE